MEVRILLPSGLFDSKTARHDFRRTSKPPAAIFASKRRRFSREEASILTSHNLWVSSHLQIIVAIKEEKTGFLWYGNCLDAATQHPILFGSLKTAAETVHPASTGYRDSGISCNENARLANEESRMRYSLMSPSVSSLWTKPLDLQATLVNGLWTLSSETDSSLDLIPHPIQLDCTASYYPIRGNKTTHPSAFDMNKGFVEQGLWKRGRGSRTSQRPSSLQKNWPDDSMNKTFTQIELLH